MLLEIGDQRRAEVAVRLLAGTDREIAPEQIEWLCAHAEGAAIPDGTNGAGTGQTVDDASDGGEC